MAHEAHLPTLADHPAAIIPPLTDAHIPAEIARDAEVDGKIGTHDGLASPHALATAYGGNALGLNDGNIAVLPIPATVGHVLKRGATAWEAGIAPAEIVVHEAITEPVIAPGKVAIWHDNTVGALRWWLIFGTGITAADNRKVELT